MLVAEPRVAGVRRRLRRRKRSGPRVACPARDPAWPSAASWDQLKRDVDGRLIEVRWPLRACHDASPRCSLALSLSGAGSVGEPRYPLPWATTTATSFLATPDEIRGDLLAAGFQIVSVRDTSAALAEALPPILNQLQTGGLPPLGEHIVSGENAKE